MINSCSFLCITTIIFAMFAEHPLSGSPPFEMTSAGAVKAQRKLAIMMARLRSALRTCFGLKPDNQDDALKKISMELVSAIIMTQ